MQRNLPSRSPSPPSSVSPAVSMESLPTTDYMRLFVKNISTDLDPSSLKSVFGRYGQVLMIKSDPKRRNVAYIVSASLALCQSVVRPLSIVMYM